jgi:predicted PurR-regulated permease PerM
MTTNLKFPFYAKLSLISIGLFIFISILSIAQQIIVPIVYSILIAIVLSPIVNFFTRKKLNRIFAITITLVLVIFIAICILTLLSAQIIAFSDSLPKFIVKFHLLMEQSIVWSSLNFNISTENIKLWITEKNAEFLNQSSSFIGHTLMNTGSTLLVLILIPVYTFMILYYQPLLLEFIHKLFKTGDQKEVNDVLVTTKQIIRSYLVGLLLEAIIIATLNATTLLILGIDYAIILGIIGALVNVIPYIGGIIAVALPMMIAFVTKSSPSYCLMILVSYIVIQFFDNHYIIPKVVASKVKINALVSVIVVLAGAALWGIPGMFLSIPLTGLIKVIFDHIESLKPWGYLLGNTMPLPLETKSPIK